VTDIEREMSNLRTFLAGLEPGPIADVTAIIQHLSPVFDYLPGAQQQAMAGYKLSRMEEPRYNPPCLIFTVERHGGIVNGSTRAELQTWSVDIGAGTAEITGRRARQLSQMAPRFKVEPIVVAIVQLVAQGADDPRLKWSKDRNTVTIVFSRAVGDGFKQTVEGRRKRLWVAWQGKGDPALAALGWKPTGRINTYAQKDAVKP
jgi:hypothetical protein